MPPGTMRPELEMMDHQHAGGGAGRRMPNGILVLCLDRCVLHWLDQNRVPQFDFKPEYGSGGPRAILKQYEPAVSDGLGTGHNGIHELPNYETLPRDLRPKPHLNKDGKKVMVLDLGFKGDPRSAPRVIHPEQRVDHETGNLITEMEDWGMRGFRVLNPVTHEPDPELEAKLEREYRERHDIPDPIERTQRLGVVVQDYQDDDRDRLPGLADQLLLKQIENQDKQIAELKAMIAELTQQKSA